MRPVYVRQKERHAGNGSPATFWVSVDRGNGKPTFVSETFFDRNNANRAARSFIALLDPHLDVVLLRWVGTVGTKSYRQVREVIE